jgi:hypothetical protein
MPGDCIELGNLGQSEHGLDVAATWIAQLALYAAHDKVILG